MTPVLATSGDGGMLFGLFELFEQAVWLAAGLGCCLAAAVIFILYLIIKWATAGGREDELEEEVKDLRAEVERLSGEAPEDSNEDDKTG